MLSTDQLIASLLNGDPRALARAISYVENEDPRANDVLREVYPKGRPVPVIGITGPAGVGKSSLTDQLISQYRAKNMTVGVVAVDPSSPFTGGAILGDRIRMQRHGTDPNVFIRSMATRGRLGGVAAATFDVIDLMAASGKDILLIETVGVGQDEVDIVKIAHTTLVVLMPGLGDEVQAMKAGLMEIADLLVINKSDRPETDKMEAELHSTLSFFQSESEWQPRIMKTVATSNLGVEALAAAIEEHGAFLVRHGKMDEKIRNQSRQRLIDTLEYQITSQIMEQGFEKFAIPDRIEDIARRRKDPRSTAAEILKHFKME